MMEYRQLGRSGLVVSELCLGTMIFGEQSGRGVSEAESRALIDAYLEAGGDFFDTADAYGEGASERILGAAIRDDRDRLTISTKVGLPVGPGTNDAGLSRKHVIAGTEASLRRLGTDYVDILYLHTHDGFSGIQESLEAVQHLMDSGKVHYLGICNQFAWRLAHALTLAEQSGLPRIICAQYQYSPICRWIEDEFFDLFAHFSVSLVPWSPLAGGVLTGKYNSATPDQGRLDTAPNLEDNRDRRLTEMTGAVVEALHHIAAERTATPSQVALAWSLAKSCVGSVALGVRTARQLEDNLGATAIKLRPEEVAAIDAAGAMPGHYPYDFMRKARPGRRSAVFQDLLAGKGA